MANQPKYVYGRPNPKYTGPEPAKGYGSGLGDTQSVMDDLYNDVCGETYDHTIEVTYEDDELLQWRCEECGAEGEEEY